MNLYLYTAECHQHIGERIPFRSYSECQKWAQCYFHLQKWESWSNFVTEPTASERIRGPAPRERRSREGTDIKQLRDEGWSRVPQNTTGRYPSRTADHHGVQTGTRVGDRSLQKASGGRRIPVRCYILIWFWSSCVKICWHAHCRDFCLILTTLAFFYSRINRKNGIEGTTKGKKLIIPWKAEK